MKSLGRKFNDMFPSSPGDSPENMITYPSVSLPINVVGQKFEIDDEVEMTFKMKVTRLEKSQYAKDVSFDLIEVSSKEGS